MPGKPTQPENHAEASNAQLILRLLGLAWKYRITALKLIVMQGFLLAMALSGLGLTGLGIDVMRRGFDSTAKLPQWPLGVQPPADWSAFEKIIAISFAILIIAIIRFCMDKKNWTWRGELTQRIVVDLRTQVYNKLQRLSFNFFDHNESGSIINRCTSDVQMVRRFVDEVMVQVLMLLISLIFFVGYMVSINVKLTIACLASTPLLWFLTALFSKMVRPGYRAARKKFDTAVLVLSENVQAVHVVKGFHRQPEQIEKFKTINDDVTAQKKWIFWCTSTFVPIIGLVPQINIMILLVYGGYLFIHNPSMTLGTLFVFAGLLQQFANKVGNIAQIANSVQRSLTGAQRVFEVIDTPEDIRSPLSPVALDKARGEIQFDHVSFDYELLSPVNKQQNYLNNNAGNQGDLANRRRNGHTLKNINFHINPGQCVAILGATGAGKSTLLSLIPRFYDPDKGKVLIDGTDLRNFDVDQLRKNIGMVFQESFLFSNTVAANISFGHPGATQEQIENAAKIAAAHEFIMNELPHGYQTVLSESGGNLSGGQRQRLAIARAILLDPPILLMDDPTAAIDPETEQEILSAMDNAMKGRTTFIVAHRLSTLRRADLVLVLDKGKIVQTGSHTQLMQTHGHYHDAALLQTADAESKRLLGMG